MNIRALFFEGGGTVSGRCPYPFPRDVSAWPPWAVKQGSVIIRGAACAAIATQPFRI